MTTRSRAAREENLYKYAVSNTPEFRDVVDAQFAGAARSGARRGRRRARAVLRVLRRPLKIPLLDLRPPRLRVLPAEAARVRRDPAALPGEVHSECRRQIESDGRLRLLDHQRIRGPALGEERADRVSARRRVALLKRKSDGDDRRRCLTYGWCQTQACVYVAVFVPGLCEDDAVTVSLSNNRLSVGPRNGPPTVDGPLSHPSDGRAECGSSARQSRWCVVKKRIWESRRELFVEDSLLLRDAGDHDQHVVARCRGLSRAAVHKSNCRARDATSTPSTRRQLDGVPRSLSRLDSVGTSRCRGT